MTYARKEMLSRSTVNVSALPTMMSPDFAPVSITFDLAESLRKPIEGTGFPFTPLLVGLDAKCATLGGIGADE